MKNSTIARPGSFSLADRDKMFLSENKPYEGLQITALSVIEVTQYLLAQRMPFVLTERFGSIYPLAVFNND